MTTLNRTFLPETIDYNKKVFVVDHTLSAAHSRGEKIDTKGKVLVKVLSKNLKRALDLHGKPYRPTEWIFKERVIKA